MNPKYRPIYLILGFSGFFVLIYHMIVTLPDIDPENVLYIAVPDMVVFFLAYKTYPVTEEVEG
jgi:hypothetical protein